MGTYGRASHAPQQTHAEVHGDAERSFILQTAMNLLASCALPFYVFIQLRVSRVAHSIKDLESDYEI